MNKLLISMAALTVFAGCTYYDYYKGGIRYTQDGKDCIYYADEYARHYSDAVGGLDGSNRIVYKNTRCEDLYALDNAARFARNDRKVLVKASEVESVKCSSKVGATDTVAPISRRFYTLTAK